MSGQPNSHNAKRVIVTGATSGIGRRCATELLERGHSVFATGRHEGRLADLQGCVGTLPVDLTTPGAGDQLISSAVETMGGIDAVVHCAGVGLIKSIRDTSDTDFVRITNTNLRATFLVAKAAAEAMAEGGGGRFLTIPGILGKAPMRSAAAYCASKYGVVGLLKSMALEYARSKVQFCLFHFGGVDSPFWDDIDMRVQRDKMIPVEVAANSMVAAIEAPEHLVTNEVTIQPESHQL